MTLSKLKFLDDKIYVVRVSKKNWNGDKIVNATKNYCYFKDTLIVCIGTKARLSVSQIFVTVTKYFKYFFFCVSGARKSNLPF